MRETIEWLMNVEKRAETFYKEIAAAFKEEKRFSEFFHMLSAEEAWHLQVMKKALKHLPRLGEGAVFPIVTDDTVREKVEDVFVSCDELLASGAIDREKLWESLAMIEFSEWNDIFVYVVGLFKGEGGDFMRAASKMQRHLKKIESFLDELPQGRKHLHVIKCLPPVWYEKILIIEDEGPVLDLLKAVLKHEGEIETAGDGKEAFAKLKSEYFDAIVSDVGLPRMDGVEVYRRAVEIDPNIGSRYLFITGRTDGEYLSFFSNYKLRYLLKPMPIKEIKRHVDEILHRPKKNH
jgi:two-component system cell cycle response regulator CpdR